MPRRTRASSTAFVSLTATRTSPMPDRDRSNDQSTSSCPSIVDIMIRTSTEPSERRSVALRILVEHLLAVATAKEHDSPGEVRAVLRGRAVDGHAADRVLGLDPHRGRRDRLRAGADRLLAPAMLDDLGEDAHGDLLWGDSADVESGGGLEPAKAIWRSATSLQALENYSGSPPACDQAHVARVGSDDPIEHLLVGVPVRGHDHGRSSGELELGESRLRRVLPELHDHEIRGPTERREGVDDGPVTHEHELGFREKGLHVDVQRATAVARHPVLEHPLRPARNPSAFSIEPDEPGPAVAEGLERFAHDDRLGAGATDPPLNAAVLADQHLGPGLGRGRRLAAD